MTLVARFETPSVKAEFVGRAGLPGKGVPAGGTTGQVLAKHSNADYDGAWVDLPPPEVTQAELDAEAAARVAAINDEALTRFGNDNTLQANINAEAAARDAALLLKADKSDTYTKVETDNRIQAVVGAAPLALDTLAEIAAQLATDESAASAVAATLASHTGNLANPHAVTKAQVGLGAVDNTADADKPVSTAQAAALADKSDTTHTHTTTAITEGTNLYHTSGRVNALIAAAVGVSVQAYSATLASWAGIAPGIASWDASNTLGADIASAATINLDAATGNQVDVTGTTTITAITLAAGKRRWVRFTGALTLTNGASLVLPGSTNITTAAGDIALFVGYAAGVVRLAQYQNGSGALTARGTSESGLSTLSPSFTGGGQLKEFGLGIGQGGNISAGYGGIYGRRGDTNGWVSFMYFLPNNGSPQMLAKTNMTFEQNKILYMSSTDISATVPVLNLTSNVLRVGPDYNATPAGVARTYPLELIYGELNDVTAGYIDFTSLSSGGVRTKRARLDASGNLGIGTTSPTAKLDNAGDTYRQRTARTPASASDAGNAGDHCWDANYLYVCIATNTWRRIAHATW